MLQNALDPRPSATVVIVRDTPTGLQVLLLKRAEKADANGGAWVFPGGVVDAGDADAAAQCVSLATGGSMRCDSPPVDPPLATLTVTAIRESFEECGLLFAHDAQGRALGDAALQAWQPWRAPLNAGERSIATLIAQSGFTLAFGALTPLARWITPLGMRKRFDTQFFLARAPVDQHVTVDGVETVEHRWLAPRDALASDSRMKLLTPTRACLTLLASCPDVDSAWDRAPSVAQGEPVMPRLARDRGVVRPVTPDEPAYAEIGRLDPLGRGDVACTIEPGMAVRLSPRVIRVTAPNPGVMTGPGTNTYLVGAGASTDPWAVIDPGPDSDAHLQALLAAAPGPIGWIFVTHTHLDHSPLARRLSQATGAKVFGRVANHAEWQDPSFKPDVALLGGETFSLVGVSAPRQTGSDGELPLRATLRVVHTPGHASNHLCFRLDEEATLFTGDHVMQKSTVVINPPDGDMAAYVLSLQALATDHGDLQWLAPGHGFLMDQPVRAFESIVAHRLRREAKVVASMHAIGPATIDDLVAQVYDDVPPAMHGAALRSLSAHLIKLQVEGRARRRADARWLLDGC